MASRDVSIGTAAGAGQGVFLRKASGLIKTAGVMDTFIFNIGLVSVGIGLGTMVLYGPAVYLGSHLIWGNIFAGVLMSLVAAGMLTWTLTIPRSGGIYPFGSRSLPPAVAQGLSFAEASCWLFLTGVAAYWIVTIGIIPTITMGGILTGSQTLTALGETLAEPGWTFLLGTIVLLVAGAILISGMQRFFLSQKIVFAGGMIGSVLLIAVLIPASREQFIANFNQLFGPDVTYDKVIESARAAGWGNPGSNLKQTLLFSNWAFLPLIGAAFSIAIGGEIKSVVKSQTVGMFAAIWLSVVLWVVSIALATKVFGYDFLGAIGYNSLNKGPSTPTQPWITLLSGVLTESWSLTFLISLGFICWIWMWIPGMQAYGERAMIAWAFDRVAPDALGQVSDRYHTPVVAITVATILTIIFLALFVFTPWFITLIVFIEIAVLAWSVVLAAGIFFPYRRPDIYERSPIADMKIFGLPVMTVACTLGFVASQIYFWLLFADAFAAGHSPVALATMGTVFVLGFIMHYIMKWIRASRGIDVSLAFREIPIE